MNIKETILNYVTKGYSSFDSSLQQRIREYVVSQMSSSGGFVNRESLDDLYYTVFGLQLLKVSVYDIPYERISGFLHGYYDKIDNFDLLEASSLGRCISMLPMEYQFDAVKYRIAERIMSFIAGDGSFAMGQGGERGNLYANFIAVGAIQDMEITISNARAIVGLIESLQLPDGGYVNDASMPIGLVPSTAAAIVLLSVLVGAVPENAYKWLLSCYCPDGGFSAAPGSGPDLLSTAVALFALQCGSDKIIQLNDMAYDCGRFADAMFAESGGYYGSIDDKNADCEYTYYGLLTKGIASEYKAE